MCQGESVYESRNPASVQIRELIRQGVDDGQLSDQQIIDGIVTRYNGEELLVPTSSGVEALAWALPAAAFVVGVAGSDRRVPPLARVGAQRLGDPTDEDYALVAAALEHERRSTMNPDQLAELEEERTFLLRSLVDLEREHAVGDVDDVDYHELKEGYTVRAAATLRAIDDGRSTLPAKPAAELEAARIGRGWAGRVPCCVDLVGAGGVVGGAHAGPGDHRSRPALGTAAADGAGAGAPVPVARRGEPRSTPRCWTSDPDNVEALTYRGWTLALDAVQRGGASSSDASDASAERRRSSTELREAVDSLRQATDLDPTYPDPKCFLGIVNFRILRQAGGRPTVGRGLPRRQPAGRHPRSRARHERRDRRRTRQATGNDGAVTRRSR